MGILFPALSCGTSEGIFAIAEIGLISRLGQRLLETDPNNPTAIKLGALLRSGANRRSWLIFATVGSIIQLIRYGFLINEKAGKKLDRETLSYGFGSMVAGLVLLVDRAISLKWPGRPAGIVLALGQVASAASPSLALKFL